MTRGSARRIAAIAALVAAGSAVPSLAATGSGHGSTSSTSGKSDAPTPTFTTIRHTHVAASGSYTVIVSVAPEKAAESVDVFVGSQAQRRVQLNSLERTRLAFLVAVRGGLFTVRVVSHGRKASFTVVSALQPAPTTSVPAVQPTGSTSPTGPTSGPYKTLVWSDEFAGAAGSAPNPANWTFDSGGGCGDGTLSTNTMNLANASLNSAGDLAITAFGATSTPPYSTAQLDSGGHFSFTYGRIEARIATPAGQGLCSAFWLVADDGEIVGWPNGGEIDIMEQIGNLPNRTNGYLHGPIGQGPNSNDQAYNANVVSAGRFTGGFHTYGLTWSPNSLTWTLDGVPFATATPQSLPPPDQWVFNGHPFHIILDEAVGGWPGNPNAATVFPASMLVDWVRVYQ